MEKSIKGREGNPTTKVGLPTMKRGWIGSDIQDANDLPRCSSSLGQDYLGYDAPFLS